MSSSEKCPYCGEDCHDYCLYLLCVECGEMDCICKEEEK